MTTLNIRQTLAMAGTLFLTGTIVACFSIVLVFIFSAGIGLPKYGYMVVASTGFVAGAIFPITLWLFGSAKSPTRYRLS